MPLAHVSEGTLPPHIEEQRTRVAIHNDAPRHTATVEAAGAYFTSGVDNSFSLDRFRRDLKIEVQSLDEEEIVFDIIGIDAAIANAFRRILIAEVPTMAIDKVFVLNNTSMTEDEVLAHRLGLIPIKADPRMFRERVGDEDPDEHHVIAFRLEVKCERAQDQGGGRTGAKGGSSNTSGVEAEMINSRVLSGALQWIPQGDQEERFRDSPIRPVHDDILIAKLRPGQAITLEAWCEKGTAKTHAKWSPVATASYRLLPEVTFKQKVTGDAAHELVSKCPMGVFDVEDLGGVVTAVAARPRSCSMCRECIREPEWDDRIKLSRVRDHFIFSIESTGILPPEVLFGEATKVLMQKAADLGQLLKDAVVGQGGGGVPEGGVQ
mmetsp:Transcript_17069/g.51636  ORF Transcript_17069/g.51636 Transcript_17069/m.51636 type:complete len:378 (+) Transcript_17069:84-1217(+)